jgi:hypothetical protein
MANIFWNENVEATANKAKVSEEAWLQSLNDKLKDPTFREQAIADGVYSPGGGWNMDGLKKWQDSTYLNAVRDRSIEETGNARSAVNQGLAQASSRSGVFNASNVGKINSDIGRKAVIDYGGIVKQETERAKGDAMQSASNEYKDKLRKSELKSNALQARFNTDALNAQSEEKGIFQSGEKLGGLIQAGLGAVAMFVPGGQLAGLGLLASGGSNLFKKDKVAGGKGTTYARNDFNNQDYVNYSNFLQTYSGEETPSFSEWKQYGNNYGNME